MARENKNVPKLAKAAYKMRSVFVDQVLFAEGTSFEKALETCTSRRSVFRP